jgi:alcohol dehydrogenase (NADP+)
MGPVAYFCGESTCYECSHSMSDDCPKRVPSYNGTLSKGSKTFGGFANSCRLPGCAAIWILAGLESSHAAPLLCAGITTYGPLKEFLPTSRIKSVGIIGIGGLGHLAILWAKALGYEHIMAFSRRPDKFENALRLGADRYVATEFETDWVSKYDGQLDVLLSTVSSSEMPFNDYLKLLRSNGKFCQLGLPDDPLPSIEVFGLVERKISLHFSDVRSVSSTEEMLELAVRQGVHPWVQDRRMSEINAVLAEMEAGKARFRYVLVADKSD